jgi:CheY-like chemotaxis protein
MQVLLIEYDETCREAVVSALRRKGYQVTAVFTGRQALALLGSGLEPDLLLTDIQLPGDLDGWATARIFRDWLPDLPVVYITPSPREIDPATKSVYLLRPIKPSLLIEAIAAVIIPESGGPPARFH